MAYALPTQLFDKRQLITNPTELITYEVDAGFDRGKPDGVFYANSTADVSRIMQWAHRAKVPLIARGAGTGLSGGAVPEHGGIIVEFARMNHVLEFDSVGRSAVLEPGLVNLVFDALAKQAGLYYPPDPSSGRSSTIGGNLGENAGGPHCFKYGVTTNYITGLEVVLADGQIVNLGGRALDYPEYDLCGILVGSEGTLGIVTRADVRLIRNPPGVKTMMVAFDSIEQAGKAVSAVISAGLVPATLEMMDQKVMGMIEAYAAANLPVTAGAGLIVEVDGYPASLDSQMEELADILTQNGGHSLRIAQSEEERQKIWYGRKSAAGAMSRLAPTFYLVDVTVPRSRLAEALADVDKICDKYQLRAGHVFHAGDGNLHPLILCDARDKELMRRTFQACDEIVELAIAKEGSITGEHGVGIEKRRYMPVMYTAAELSAMLDFKQMLDPHRLLNPGKVFPDDIPVPKYVEPVLPTENLWTPATAEEAAAGLRALSAAKQRVQISSQADPKRSEIDLWLSTNKLQGIKVFAQDDLYVTVGAGTPLQELQTYLQQHGMQAPLATPWPATTIGGLIATNINAPLRMRYGALRDLILATTVALPDGRVIRAGRAVVKNVAGYDLPKIFVGSQGTLGLLTDVTLKLIPAPRAQRTLAVPVAELKQSIALAQRLVPQAMVASAVLVAEGAQLPGLQTAPYTLLYTAEGLPEDVDAELTQVAMILRHGGATNILETNLTGTDIWASHLNQASTDGMAIRIGLPAQALSEISQTLPPLAGQKNLLDFGAGMIYVTLPPETVEGSLEAVQVWLTAVRRLAHARGGYAVVMAMPDHLQGRLDPWGYQPEAMPLMRALKARWDPAGILNTNAFIL
ncbi:MAG: FAD-binding protein [Chloroflexi bacterium]|nr:FAD-binding protein [Chloroflexota bacterium]